MFGNRIGWGISAAMVVAFCGVLWIFVQVGRLTPPTAFARDLVLNQPIELPVSPATVFLADQPGSAGSIYRRVIDEYHANTDRYERIARESKPNLHEHLPAVEALIEAAPLRNMDLFERSPEKALAYTTRDTADLQALVKVGELANRLALFHAVNGNKERARELFQAVFALGTKLFQERVSYAEMAAGMGLMAASAEGLRKHVADEAEKQRLAEFLDGYRRYSPALQEVQKKINTIDSTVSYRHAGDVFYIIQTPGIDRMWRAEALMKAGRYRFDAGRAADQRGALRIIQPFLEDPDPVLRHAATQATNLTLADYRRLGG